MILAYTQKVGETNAIKKIIEFLESQRLVADTIKKKIVNKEAFKI